MRVNRRQDHASDLCRRFVPRPSVAPRGVAPQGKKGTFVLARPTGVARARTRPGFRMIQVEGAESWEATVLNSA
jgi:hypothetical protein